MNEFLIFFYQLNCTTPNQPFKMKNMHRIKNGSKTNFTFTCTFHPPNGCHKFNHFVIFFGIFFSLWFAYFHTLTPAFDYDIFLISFFIVIIFYAFFFVNPICVFFFTHTFVTPFFALKIYLFSSDSISYYYEFSKEQDYICSKPEDSGMHQCTTLPPYRIGPMVCNGKYV